MDGLWRALVFGLRVPCLHCADSPRLSDTLLSFLRSQLLIAACSLRNTELEARKETCSAAEGFEQALSRPSRDPDRDRHYNVCVEPVDSVGERLCHDLPDDGMRLAAGMVQNSVSSEHALVDDSEALARHNGNVLYRPRLLSKVPLAPARDLERANTAPTLPVDWRYQLRKLYGYP